MNYQLINNDTGEIVFLGTQRECSTFLGTYPTGSPVLTCLPVEQ